MRIGRSMAFTRVELTVDERIVAHGSHTKFIAKARETLAAMPATDPSTQ